MKLVTVFSDTHRPLLEQFFLPSYTRYPDGFDSLNIHYYGKASSAAAVYETKEWLEVPKFKIRKLIEEADKTKDGDFILYSDCDVQWFGPLDQMVALAPALDLVAQWDAPGLLCTGLFRMKVSHAMRLFLKAWLHETTYGTLNDQFVLNNIIKTSGLSFDGYDNDLVWSVRKIWRINDRVPTPPDGMLVHHGNWTTNPYDKAALMRAVKQGLYADCQKATPALPMK